MHTQTRFASHVQSVISRAALFSLLLLPLQAWPRDLPESLFDIRLGTRFTLSEGLNSRPENLSIKKFTGSNRFLGYGLYLFFEPSRTFDGFAYIENPDEVGNEAFQTSFLIYAMPTIPDTASSIAKIDVGSIEWEVLLISWRDRTIDEEDKYLWAEEMCRTFDLDFAIEPEITKNKKDNWLICSFSSGSRKFIVEANSGVGVELSYSDEILAQREEEYELKLRTLKLEQIRPYD